MGGAAVVVFPEGETIFPPGGELVFPGVDEEEGSPGTTPWPDRRAMRARITLSHLISSSSLGAQRRSVRFVVTTLNVCAPAALPLSSCPPEDEAWCWCGDCGPGDAMVGWLRFGGRSYSSASMMNARGIWRWGFVSCCDAGHVTPAANETVLETGALRAGGTQNHDGRRALTMCERE